MTSRPGAIVLSGVIGGLVSIVAIVILSSSGMNLGPSFFISYMIGSIIGALSLLNSP